MKTIKIGYALPDRKAKNLGFTEASVDKNILEKFKIVKIDPFNALNEQGGPFDIIIHKINDLINDSEEINSDYVTKETALMNFLENVKRDNTILIDSYKSCCILANRWETIDVIIKCVEIINQSKIKATKQLILTEEISNENLLNLLMKNKMEFPIIVKPMSGQSSMNRYNMVIYPGVKKLPNYIHSNTIVQEFINHDGVLYKIYTIGNVWYVINRPSFKNIVANNTLDPINFRTDVFNKIKITSDNTLKDHILFQNELNDEKLIFSSKDDKNTAEYYDVFREIIQTLQNLLNCYLLGIDIIISSNDKEFYIIDINYMPSYKYMNNFMPDFLNLANEIIERKTNLH